MKFIAPLSAAFLVTALAAGACSTKSRALRPEDVETAHGRENPLLVQDKFISLGQEFEDTLLKKLKSGFLRSDDTVVLPLFSSTYESQNPNRWHPHTEEASIANNIELSVLVDQGPRTVSAKETMENLFAYRAEFREIVDSTVHHIEFFKCPNLRGIYCSKAYMRFRGTDLAGHPRQDYMEFEVHGSRDKATGKLAILDLKLLSGTSVRNLGPAHFSNLTKESGISFRHAIPTDMESYTFNLMKWMGSGVSSADVDGDGDEDALFLNHAGASLFYENRGKAKFRDRTRESGLSAIRSTSKPTSAVFADFDNDGDQDLLVIHMEGREQIFANDGKGRFTEATDRSGLLGTPDDFAIMAAVADVDNDGLLDVYVAQYGNGRKAVPETFIYSRNGNRNRLYRNLGKLTFEDITDKAGVADTGWSLAPAFFDYDNDGDQDLYVANDFGLNTFFANRGDGTFENVTFGTRAVSYGAGMGVSIGDYNQDGFFDLYLSNIYSNNRWFTRYDSFRNLFIKNFLRSKHLTFSRKLNFFRELGEQFDHGEYVEESFKANLTDGNVFFLHQGDGTYRDIAWQTRTHFAQWAWANDAIDYDQDGDQDIFIVNGFHTGSNPEDT